MARWRIPSLSSSSPSLSLSYSPLFSPISCLFSFLPSELFYYSLLFLPFYSKPSLTSLSCSHSLFSETEAICACSPKKNPFKLQKQHKLFQGKPTTLKLKMNNMANIDYDLDLVCLKF